jgi:predicted AAA+ superfamily ATPase
LIQNFNPFEFRNDVGALWENFLITERMKRNHYHSAYGNSFFWRTKQQQEIDYVEEAGGRMSAFEFKWNPNAKIKKPSVFLEAYPADFQIISQNNFRDFVGMM